MARLRAAAGAAASRRGVLVACLLACALRWPVAPARAAEPGAAAGPGGPVLQVSVEEAARRLGAGGYAVVMRHASTEPGMGDPPGFSLQDCATQRNLSAAGRAEAAAAGQALRSRGVRFDEVRSSAWCRCVDTARLGFGEPRVWAALNSFFDEPARAAQQTAAVRAELQRVTAPRNLLLVTHQVNITALTDLYPAQGELIVLRWRDGAARPEFRFRVPATEIRR